MFEKIIRIPHDSRRNYDEDYVEERREWLSKQTNVKLSHISHYSIKATDAKGNIENFIGVTQTPLGLVGPLKINGEFAQGTFYVPFSTTEGALVSTYQRGAVAITKAGGAKVSIVKDENHISPVFVLNDLEEVKRFTSWVKENFNNLKDKVKEATDHGELLKITPFVIGARVILKFSYFTQDAMGANMIGIATERICKYITQNIKVERYFLRSNLSSEKKASGVNMLFGYGKEVLVEAIIPKKIVIRHLNSTPEDIHSAWHSWILGCIHANMIGGNAHFANGLAAIFIACGQDVAHIPNASVGITLLELTKSGDLYAAIKLPNILVGTVGGGTALGTQRECLDVLGCYGKGKSKKLAEVIAATLLAGEVGICAGITSEDFLEPHKIARVHTREKALQEEAK